MPPDDHEVVLLALEEMERFRKEGKIRAIGASIKGLNATEHTAALCRQYMTTGKVDAIQLIYSILRQRLLNVIEEASGNGIGIVARTVLESGLLTGKNLSGKNFRGG